MSTKESNEITVKITCGLAEFYELLENKGFAPADRFSLDDTYFFPSGLNISVLPVREILSKAVLVREIRDKNSNQIIKKITYKTKAFNTAGEILSQTAVNCEVSDLTDAKKLLSALDYRELMRIVEDDVVYQKDGFELAVKDIHGGVKLIEIETEPDNSELDTIEKLKQKLFALHLPIDETNFFVKKAEIALNKILTNSNGRNAQ